MLTSQMLFEIMTNATKNSNDEARKLTKTSAQNFYLKKLITRKNFTLKKKLQKTGIILKNVMRTLRTLKSLGMPSKEGRQSKISLKENNVVSFNSKDNANTFCRFFSNIPNSNFESKLLRSIIRRFEMNVRILFYNS